MMNDALSMGLTGPSALLMKELSVDDLNPLERHRLREAIRKFGGDQSLLPLADEGLDGALVHRDYSRLAAVHVRLDNDGLSIFNPGGFVEGVTLQNLLMVAPRSRNLLLADIVR